MIHRRVARNLEFTFQIDFEIEIHEICKSVGFNKKMFYHIDESDISNQSGTKIIE